MAMEAMIRMMATTINNSISEKPLCFSRCMGHSFNVERRMEGLLQKISSLEEFDQASRGAAVQSARTLKLTLSTAPGTVFWDKNAVLRAEV
jgi:hypothetical protein